MEGGGNEETGSEQTIMMTTRQLKLNAAKNLSAISAIVVFALVVTFFAGVSSGQIPQEDLDRIREALPKTPSARVFRAKRLLIFTLCKGYRHASIPYGVEAIKRMGIETGTFIADASDDSSVFEKDNLEKYDGVLFLSSTGTLFDDARLKQNLLAFVKSGKGIIGIHAATDCFYDWTEYGEMMGGYFDGHPWSANSTVTLKIDDPESPICKAFEGKPFTITDEIYQLKGPYSRSRLHVLTSIDTTKTDMTKSGIHRTDGDFAVSWIRNYGKGRVFYCSMGHRKDIYWNPVMLRHYLDGIQFALGDLPADAQPSEAAKDDAAGKGEVPGVVQKALEGVGTYEFGQSRLALSIVEDYVHEIAEDAVARSAMEGTILGSLQNEATTHEGKAFLCRQLALIGGDVSVPTLAEMLRDPKMSDMARYALERIPGEQVDGTLLTAGVAEDIPIELRVGIINSIAKRASIDARTIFERIWKTDDERARVSSLYALAAHGGISKVRFLADLMKSSDENQSADECPGGDDVLHSALASAESLTRDRKAAESASIYEWVYRAEVAERFKIAALQGLSQVNPKRALQVIAERLNEGAESKWSRVAAATLVGMKDVDLSTLAKSVFDHLGPTEAQAMFLEALGERGKSDVADFVQTMAANSTLSPAVQTTAVDALGSIGNADSVRILATLASTDGNETVREAAKHSLDRLRNPSVDAINGAIANAMFDSRLEAGIRAVLVRSVGNRRETQLGEQVLRLVRDDDANISTAAWETAGKICTGEDVEKIARSFFRLGKSAATSDEIHTAGAAMVELAARLTPNDRNRLVKVVANTFDLVNDQARAAVMPMFAAAGTSDALANVGEALEKYGSSSAVKGAIIRALGNWPNASAADLLLGIVSNEKEDATMHRAAFDGCVRVIVNDSSMEGSRALELFTELLEKSGGEDETRTALNGVGQVDAVDAATLVEPYLRNESLHATAARALLSIATLIGDDDPEAAIRVIDQVMASAESDAGLQSEAGETLDRIERDRDFINSWVVSGPYSKKDVGGGELIDVVFAPEEPAELKGAVSWKAVDSTVIAPPGFIDLMKIKPRSNCCAYLRTRVYVPSATKAKMEIGSDDGVKIWLNGQVIHTNNVMRGAARAQDVVEVDLNAGWNTLMFKITQGGGDWKACCRIRSADGFHIEGIRIEAP